MREPLRKDSQINPCREMRVDGLCPPQTSISNVARSYSRAPAREIETFLSVFCLFLYV